jgi:diguanylate cyclase (GGDEF)-like protein
MAGPAALRPRPTDGDVQDFGAAMRRVSVFSITVVGVWLAAAILLVRSVVWSGWSAVGPEFLVILLGAVLFELRPLVVLQYPAPTKIHLGQSFGFAALYLWGPAPAIVVTALSWGLGLSLRRKEPWRVLFNMGQFVVAMAAAGAAMVLLGGSPLVDQGPPTWRDAGWILATWVVHFVVNGTLVALPSTDDVAALVDELRASIRWDLVADLLADTLALVIVVLALSGPIYPLILLLPLLLFARTFDLTRSAHHEAMHDSLTGLANRRLFITELNDAVARRQSVAVMIIDMDGFKDVNDQYGHTAGDTVLATTAGRIQSSVRSADVVGRYGGDEFAILLTERPDPIDAVEVAERIRRSISRVVPFGQAVLPIGASIGVATLVRNEPLSADEALRRADDAMYLAKHSGSGVAVWAPEVDERAARRRPR